MCLVKHNEIESTSGRFKSMPNESEHCTQSNLHTNPVTKSKPLGNVTLSDNFSNGGKPQIQIPASIKQRASELWKKFQNIKVLLAFAQF